MQSRDVSHNRELTAPLSAINRGARVGPLPKLSGCESKNARRRRRRCFGAISGALSSPFLRTNMTRTTTLLLSPALISSYRDDNPSDRFKKVEVSSLIAFDSSGFVITHRGKVYRGPSFLKSLQLSN